ncbi:MAG: metal-dependent hydrolase [Planctomycetales bacterium]|nr:metal-dependent hydrolase [Planctomycetales bacterium]
MTTELTWLGHGTWLIETGGKKILLDPFLNENPAAPIGADDVDADYILISHGHFDHVADAASIANRCDAQLIAVFEIAQWFAENHGVKQTLGMNLGGGVDLPFGRVKLTQAWHSSQLPDGSYGGNPAGYLLSLPEGNVYFACDTGLFADMQQIGEAGLRLAVLPIGDMFTMGPDDAVTATQWLKPQRVAPAHYNTWPPIAQDAAAWAEKILARTHAMPLTPKPGEKFAL